MSCPFNNLEKYKDIFGEPNKGIHSYRFLNVAIVDVVATIASAGLISYLIKFNFIIVLILLFILSIILHYVFCVDTEVIKLIKSVFNKNNIN